MSSLPLLMRALDSPLAWYRGQPISAENFLHQANCLAECLPAVGQVANLCLDRYAFSVSFAATIIAGKTNLLPANRQPGTLDELKRRYPDACVLSDCLSMAVVGELVDPTPFLSLSGVTQAVPRIAAEQLAAIVHTSGSTGCSSSIDKSWRTLYESSRINAREFGFKPGDPLHYGLATVPPQHMWGLETSVLLPWFAPLAMAPAQTLFVADMLAALQQLPSPRVLISTPVHLRAAVECGLPTGLLQRIYSATAPLSPTLAASLESRFQAELLEVFGCSEVGCFARRNAAKDEPWRLFSGFTVSEQEGAHWIAAAHLPAPVRLMDCLAMCDQQHFRLQGRSADLVNIAGKRASLAELTQILLDIPGVLDGVFLMPADRNEGPVARLAALVVAPSLTVSEIRAALSKRVDPAFLPRPLRLVEALPRSESGKLPREALMHCFEHAR